MLRDIKEEMNRKNEIEEMTKEDVNGEAANVKQEFKDIKRGNVMSRESLNKNLTMQRGSIMIGKTLNKNLKI